MPKRDEHGSLMEFIYPIESPNLDPFTSKRFPHETSENQYARVYLYVGTVYEPF